MSPEAPRSRTVVTPVSSVRRAFSAASTTVTPAGRRGWLQRPGAGRRIPEVGHVRVEIDQARDQREAAEIDHLDAGRRRARCRSRRCGRCRSTITALAMTLPDGSTTLPARIALVAANARRCQRQTGTGENQRDHEDTKHTKKQDVFFFVSSSCLRARGQVSS